MGGKCCCSIVKPRYKILVDDIFPATSQEGLLKNNLEKLLFFAMKSPEKLDRIGEYLAYRLSRDIYRGRREYVIMAMEALDRLLITCHSNLLNVFVDSFLKMVHKLLETTDPCLIILATASFIKFSHIEEDVPDYHRSYDFFVEKFCAMCHDNNKDSELHDKLSTAGIQGLHGIIRKTASDDLQINIWASHFMNKIIPSLLFNMQKDSHFGSQSVATESPSRDSLPSLEAEKVFRELIHRASFGNITSIISPVLVHLDMHKLWVPNTFAIHCFNIIICSVQAQYGYIVIQKLVNHLDDCSLQETVIKTNIINVLKETVVVSAGSSIGPSVLDVFNALLRHLKFSVESDAASCDDFSEENTFQEAIITTIGEFANNLPNYQKIEKLMFVMSKIPAIQFMDDSIVNTERSPKQLKLQMKLLRTILKVATKYKTDTMSKAFPVPFLEPLMKMSLDDDPSIRIAIQHILHTLIDRHDNVSKCSKVTIPFDIRHLELNVDEPLRQDVLFMKKHGPVFYWYLMENLKLTNNTMENYDALYCTICLICIEIAADEVLLEMVRFALGMQRLCTASSNQLPISHKCCIQATVAAFFNILNHLLLVPEFDAHVQEVMKLRRKICPWYLPDLAFNRTNTAASYSKSDITQQDCLFSADKLLVALKNSGRDGINLDAISMHGPPTFPDTVVISRSGSTSELNSINLEFPSGSSTPGQTRGGSQDEVTFETLKKVLEDDTLHEREESERQRRVAASLKNGVFEDMVARSEEQSTQINNRLNKIFSMISYEDLHEAQSVETERLTSGTILDMKYPSLYGY